MKKGEKFEQLMSRRGFNRNTLSKASGVPYSTIDSMIKRDFEKASIDAVLALTTTLGVCVHDFIPEAKPKTSIVKDTETKYLNLFNESSKDARLREVDYYGQISAGERDSLFIKEYAEQIELPKVLLGKYKERTDIFVMKASGNSMNKVIPDGSFVVCIPVEAHELHHGDIVIYSYENELSMKRYRVVGDNIAFTPESHLDKYFDFVVSKDTINNVKIIAKVISYHVILE